jgi:hypothetical protein
VGCQNLITPLTSGFLLAREVPDRCLYRILAHPRPPQRAAMYLKRGSRTGTGGLGLCRCSTEAGVFAVQLHAHRQPRALPKRYAPLQHPRRVTPTTIAARARDSVHETVVVAPFEREA